MESKLKGKKIKPSEYPERMLKALVKGYNDPSNTEARVEGLDVPHILSIAGMEVDYIEGHISLGEIYNALGQLKQENYISGDKLYKPTSRGRDHVRERIWYHKAWDYIGRHLLLAVILQLLIAIAAGIIVWLLMT